MTSSEKVRPLGQAAGLDGAECSTSGRMPCSSSVAIASSRE
ncbi:hypothetical protein [Streptomyces sp. NPDC059209]